MLLSENFKTKTLRLFLKMLAELTKFLPKDRVLLTDEAVRPYECDGLSAYTQRPGAVVLPSTLEEIQQILQFCRTHKIPIVARGAGTGLSGGALPHSDGVLLSLAKFNRILAIDPVGKMARVEPGVRNLAISQAVAPYGLYYAPDPSSQIACTIGGNVAENSGGVHCLKYGLTVHNILEIKLLTIDGDLLTLGSQALDAPGYDLLALLTGSEGLLGIIVEITVKLLPKPECAQVLLAAFADVNQAGAAVADIIATGIIPAGLEMMDNAALRAAEAFVKVGYPIDAAAILLCELDGSQEEVAMQISQVQTVLAQAGATEIRCSENEQQRLRLWAGRKGAFPAVGRISPDYYCMDGTIPRKHLATVLQRIDKLSKIYQLPVANVFHAGDGNLHPLILFDANQPGELERAEEFGGKILELCVEVGGTVTGEHGVGVEKLNQMCAQFNSAELLQFHAIKAAFDPEGLLNPGKAIPTLHRCAEWGAMHIHQGQLPFPNLERF
ncbi:MAG: FAD-binding oxidoreductase [Beggiatoa sp. IS2]|nr:MAG: FAD-binding oxidoreductase [Beggiatoa sp. IS2]